MSGPKSARPSGRRSARRASRRTYMARRVVALGIVGLIVFGAVRVVGQPDAPATTRSPMPKLRRRPSRASSASRPIPTRPHAVVTCRRWVDDRPADTAPDDDRPTDGRQPGQGVHRGRQRRRHVRPVPAVVARQHEHRRHRTQLQGVVRARPARLLRLAGRARSEAARRSTPTSWWRRSAATIPRGWRSRTARSSCPTRSPTRRIGRAEYRARVGEAMDLMGANGATVVWVGIPNDDNPDVTARLRIQDQAVRAEAAERDNVDLHRHVGPVLRPRRQLGRVRHRSPRQPGQGRPRRRRLPPQHQRRRDPRPRHRPGDPRRTPHPRRRDLTTPLIRGRHPRLRQHFARP